MEEEGEVRGKREGRRETGWAVAGSRGKSLMEGLTVEWPLIQSGV